MRAAIAAACLTLLAIQVIENYVKNSLQIAGGVVGAVIGFVATLLTLELVGFGNRADPVGSGLLALFVLAPAGAIAGLVAGTTLAMRMRGGDNTGSLAGNSFKAFGALIVLCAAAGTAYYVYAVTSATPWLNPNAANPVLEFEIRLPAGMTPPNSARDIAIELQTDINTMRANQGSTGSAATATGRSLQVKSTLPFAPRIGSWRSRSTASPIDSTS
jgi:hypothetical protein